MLPAGPNTIAHFTHASVSISIVRLFGEISLSLFLLYVYAIVVVYVYDVVQWAEQIAIQRFQV